MSTAVTVNTIVNGDPAGNGKDLTAWAISPFGANTIAGDVNGNTFRNPTDRRTFVLLRNLSGTHDVGPLFRDSAGPGNASYLGGAAGLSLNWGLTGETPNNPLSTYGVPAGLLEDGKTKLYGPLPSLLVGGNEVIVTYHRATDLLADATGISIGVFYLPAVDELSKWAVIGAEGDFPESGYAGVQANIETVQTITLDGLEVVFSDHVDFIQGFGFPVRNDGRFSQGKRRLLWVRNNSGSSDVNLIPAGGDRYNNVRGGALNFYPGSSSDSYYQSRWSQWVIDDGEEVFLGAFDENFWYSGGSIWGADYVDSMTVRALVSGSPVYTPGITAGLDFAWLELPL